ncbi:SDR family oxidoreductase [Brooklawnia cerclae]|uniref:Gluconate 5-dehydrogenase n=1 Tax=Brooklawnia cerclae TaxID=349934 RepID=A0ABX0SIX3_9ACTN|nr:SDR family oxidoreductase [Brooklawnia cerclae]NIH58338.1 gluconate 5-dehydrogenase [Brooklawnia cerclae]
MINQQADLPSSASSQTAENGRQAATGSSNTTATTDLFDLRGHVALVTGAGSGIGYAIAEGLAAAGARVVINGRNERKAQAAVERIGAGRARRQCFDVTDPTAIGSAFDLLEKEGWPIDIVVNNAGVQRRGPMLELTEDDWHTVIDGDLTSVFLVSREAVRRMLARGCRGKIINVASLASQITRPNVGPYTAAKGGVRLLTQAMTAEWAPLGICVNALAPGHVKTELTASLATNSDFDRWVERRTPLGRWSTPDDLKGPVVFLASAASDYVTGQTLFVDGGTVAVM